VLSVGSILGGKLQLERLAGVGGMGEVFQGRYLDSGRQVAVKVLRTQHAQQLDQLARFEREARVLGELDHPNIVRYIEHAVTPVGQPYLVMEWLDGEDLATRLRTRPLSVQETLAIGKDVAEAIAAAHARGVIHRDLKPGNVFLVRGAFLARGEFNQSKVLDFGIARFADWIPLTQTGAMLGTVGYMAPEQTRRRGEVTPAADVFSLGCLLFEALTGRRAFEDDHPATVRGKLEFHTALPDPCRQVPVGLEALIEWMLAGEPEQRPRDGAVVKAALAALHAEPVEPLPRVSRVAVPSLTRSEQRLLAIVMIAAPAIGGPAVGDDGGDPATMLAGVRRVAALHGGHVEVLSEGSVVVALRGTQIATDQAALAARCALALRAEAPDHAVALAMGLSGMFVGVPGGEVVDRAASLLARCLAATPAAAPGATRGSGEPAPVAIDDTTAGLLDGRFDVREAEAGGEAGVELHGEREVTTGTRRLLGRPTACVGRDRELASLAGIFDDCAGEPVAQAVLVTGPAGIGKSRLAAELMTMIRARHEAAVCWIGRGDSLRGGSAFALLRQALRGAVGLHEGEPLAARQDLLRARVARHVPGPEQRRVTEFLGELLSAPFPDDGSAPLRTARREPAVMNEQVRRAAQDFLRAECSAHPVLLVLEDLHWGDLPTVRFVDAALRSLRDQPWMVLALARPEVQKVFPDLWSERRTQEIRLPPLTRMASQRLVRQTLGDQAGPDTLVRLVTHADGNPFYLEELIRAVAERGGEAFPATVVAMVQARLGGLVDEERRILRAASVFGEVFWPDGVARLLRGALPAPAVHAVLESLIEQEFVLQRHDNAFAGRRELGFRHALLREAAYAMLAEDDRRLGHRLAAAWLEQQGESDPMVLAEHCDRGGEAERAASFYFQAAERALRADDTAAAVARARRALALGVPDAERVVVLGFLAAVHVWRSEGDEAIRCGEDALRLAVPGTEPWARAVTAKLAIALRDGQSDAAIELIGMLQSVDPAPDALVSIVVAINFGGFILNRWARFALVEHGLQRVHAIVEPVADREPVARGWMHMGHVAIEPWAHEDPWTGLQHAQAARASFREANHRQNALLAQLLVGMNLWFLGALAEAEHELRGVLEGKTVYGPVAPLHLFCFTGTLADRGAIDEAHEVVSRTIAAWQARGLRMFEGSGHRILAEVLRRRGEPAAAEREARIALGLLRSLPLERLATLASLAAALLAQGRAAEALATAEDAMAGYQALGAFGFRGAFARLVHVEALDATGDHAGACRALATARDRLQLQAARIGDPAVRRSFLEDLPENARTVALARQWLDAGGPLDTA
jgi:tRNA A-37 threonylcarbamoyl transferase component Bud32/tetratricopeptide (TPR) repeat protein